MTGTVEACSSRPVLLFVFAKNSYRENSLFVSFFFSRENLDTNIVWRLATG